MRWFWIKLASVGSTHRCVSYSGNIYIYCHLTRLFLQILLTFWFSITIEVNVIQMYWSRNHCLLLVSNRFILCKRCLVVFDIQTNVWVFGPYSHCLINKLFKWFLQANYNALCSYWRGGGKAFLWSWHLCPRLVVFKFFGENQEIFYILQPPVLWNSHRGTCVARKITDNH